MFDVHIGDLAELYVLGTLDATERAAVEAHIATCGQCLRQVGEAEEALLALERGELAEMPPDALGGRMQFGAPPVRRYAGFALAAAAGLVLGVLTMLPGYFRTAGTQDALVAMINSHFNHAQFAAVAPGRVPAAKVIFARDRSWLYVIATGSERYAVYAVAGATSRRLGELQPGGSTSSLFVNLRFDEDTIELRDGTTTVERAHMR